MRRRILILVIAMTSVSACNAQALPPADRVSLSDASDFHLITATASIPREVFLFCADANGRLAAPGEKWNAIDVMIPNLPTRRIVWVSKSDKYVVVHYVVVHYEQGGFFYSSHIAIARAKSNGTGYDLIWRADGPRLRDYREFARALNENAFEPERPFER